MSIESYLTKEGYQNLIAELNQLKKVSKPEVATKINEAREMGGVDENSMYDTYIAEQGYIEGRIKEIEEILGKSQIIDKKSSAKDGANVGNTIHVVCKGKEEQFMLVGSAEADPASKRISIESPVGRALLGVKPGETVVVETPQVKIEYTVKAIK